MTNDERARLDVIEAKVDTILVKLGYIEKQTGDHEERIRLNEAWRYAIPPAIIIAGLSIVIAVLQ